MKGFITCMAMISLAQAQAQSNMMEISKNNMTVRWRIENELIHFEMEAPTHGWVAIGFSESASLTGTYLLMGRIQNGKSEVVEHFTDQPGSYRPIIDYGEANQTISVSGDEVGNMTRLKFSIPILKVSKYHKNLSPGTTWNLLLAYSISDDFQHHSIMRTSVEIIL
jgi:DOMON domain